MTFLNEPYSLTVVAGCGCLAGVTFESSPQGIAEFLGQWPDELYRVEVSTDVQHAARRCDAHAVEVSS